LHRSKDIDHRLNVVVRDHSRAHPSLNGRQASQDFRPGGGIGPGYRNVFESLQTVNSVLRSLRSDAVTDPVLGIQPECGRSLKASAERDQQILSDIALREADLLRFRAIHVNVQVGLIERLLDS